MTIRMTRRAALLATARAGMLLTAACVQTSAPTPDVPPNATASAKGGPSFDPVLANSELVVGRNRFALGLIGQDRRPITDARVELGFFQISGQQATKRSEAVAQFRWLDIESRGMYVAPVSFPDPGRWGVEVTVQRPGRAADVARMTLEVVVSGRAPMIGSVAPRATGGSPTSADEPCSNVPPCELHGPHLEEALANGRPSVLLFATPGYCMTATCAPVLSVVLDVRARQAGRANFVHVEIYKDPRNQLVADAVTRWNLPSEPWTFLVDAGGTIVDRYEGIVTVAELEAALTQLG